MTAAPDAPPGRHTSAHASGTIRYSIHFPRFSLQSFWAVSFVYFGPE
jgi:hypothetical protein